MSNPAAGWFPDPGGQPGMFRFWDGSAWSAALSPTPHAAPPAQGLVPGSGRAGGGGGAGGAYGAGAGGPGGVQRSTASGPGATGPGGYGPGAFPGASAPARRGSRGWIVALVAVGVVVVVLVGLAVRGVSNLATGEPTSNPGGQPTQDICPEQVPATAAPPQDPADGRVHGGALSFPMLPSPWEAPAPDERVPFGRDVMTQVADVESYPEGRWVASVLVGELIAGDGFFTPEQGAEIVVECVVGVFYGENTVVQREDRVSEAASLDGRDAWLVESHLTFDIPGLETKGETLILMIVATGEATASLFYASVPDTSPEYMQPARDSLAALRVDE